MREMTLIIFLIVSLLISFPAFSQEDSDSDESANSQKAKKAPPVQSEEVVVTGTRIESDPQDLPADVTIIDQKRLRQPGMKNAFDALIDVPGVSVNPRQDNGVLNSVDVRGLRTDLTSGGSLLILLDGIPQRRLSFGGPYMGALPYDAVYRMELAKGPTASLYGRNALSGALQLFTDPGTTTQHYDMFTSFEYPAVATHASLKGSGPIGKDLPHTYSITGSFTKAEGWQEDNELTRGDMYANINFYPSSGDHLRIIGGFFFNKEGMVAPVLLNEDGQRLDGIDRDTNLGVDGHNDNTLYEYRLGAIWTHAFTDWFETKLIGAYWHGDTYWENGIVGTAPDEGTIVDRIVDDRSFIEDNYFSELSFTFDYKTGSWLTGSVVVGGSYEYLTFQMDQSKITTNDSLDEEDNIDFSSGLPLDLETLKEPPKSTWVYGDPVQRDTFETNYGVFLRDQTTFINRIHLTGGVRYDAYDRTQVDPDTEDEMQSDDSAVSPSAGLGFSIIKNETNRLNLYGAWGLGFSPIFRSISNTEFTELDPERSQSIEVGIKSSWIEDRIGVNVVGYQMQRFDIVDYNNDEATFENQGDWEITGVEGEIKGRPIPQILLFANYTWREPLIAKYTVDPSLEGNQIAGMSDQQAVGGIKGRGFVAQSVHGIGGGTYARYFSKSYTNPDNDCELAPYVLWDAYVSYFYQDTLEISLFAKNLLDEEYFSAVYGNTGYKSGFEGTPRTFGGQVRAHF